jgi:hypothetical protein
MRVTFAALTTIAVMVIPPAVFPNQPRHVTLPRTGLRLPPRQDGRGVTRQRVFDLP